MKMCLKQKSRLLTFLFVISVLVMVIAACQAEPASTTKSGAAASNTSAPTVTAAPSPAQTTTVPIATSASTTVMPTTVVPITVISTIAPTTVPALLKGPFSDADLVLTVDGQSFALLSDAAPLLKILGSKYQKTEAESCVYEGFDKTFDYGYLQLFTIPKGKQDLFDGIYLMDNRYQTARGIRVGAAKAAVITAYGKNEGDGDLVYNKSGDSANLADPNLTFVIEKDKVMAISYYSGSNAQGAGNGG